MPLSFGYLRAPTGFVYPSKKKQLADRKAGSSALRPNKPVPLFNHWKRGIFRITIRYKWWIPPARQAVRNAISNFNNGRSLYQQIIGDRWAQEHGLGGNPHWMGMSTPPISMLINREGDGWMNIYCTVNNRITANELRRAIWHEIEAESQPWHVVVSITVSEVNQAKTERYALFRPVY